MEPHGLINKEQTTFSPRLKFMVSVMCLFSFWIICFGIWLLRPKLPHNLTKGSFVQCCNNLPRHCLTTSLLLSSAGMSSSLLPPLLLLCGLLGLVSGLRPKTSSFSQVPFLSMWNAPTHNCLSKYGVDLNLGTFDIAQNLNQSFMGGNVTIFYTEKLGRYPRYSSQGEAVNGGVPQNASLDEHLRLASGDINTYIPDRAFQGLAVVDWESWNPVWERNWDSKQVYLDASRALMRARHLDWTPAQVTAAARVRFEQAGRAFMEETLKLGEEERPNGLWGYYGFPDCYNYLGNKINYTGECPAVAMKRNDQLLWLWNSSSALYPDIYLSLNLRGQGKEVLLYTRHRILEAMRVGAQVTPSAPPVYPYSRIVYTYTLDFLSQASSCCLNSMLFRDSFFSSLFSILCYFIVVIPPAGAPGLHCGRERCFRVCRDGPVGQQRLRQVQGTIKS